MGNQNDFQSQVTAGLGLDKSDDNSVLSLDSEDLAEIGNIKDGRSKTEPPVVNQPAQAQQVPTGGNVEDVTNDPLNNTSEPTYTKEQVQAIIRTRVGNMQKKIDNLEKSNSAVDRIAEISGLSREQLVLRLNGMTDAEQAKILGISPEQVAMARNQRSAQVENEKTIKKLNRDVEMAALKADKKFSDIDLFMDDVLAKVEDHPSLSLKDAYTLVKGEMGITAQVRDAEQRVANSQAAAKQKQQVNPVGADLGKPPKMSEQTIANASKLGMDPNTYDAFKQIGDLDAYRAYKKAQKGG